MSQQASPLTYESVLKLMRKNSREMKRMSADTDKRLDMKFQEVAKQIEATNKAVEATQRAVTETQLAAEKTRLSIEATERSISATNTKIGALDLRVGKMVEKLVGEGNLVAQFRELGYKVKRHSRHMIFGEEGTSESGEIDLFMEDGDVAVLVEVKTTLKMDHVVEHIERMEKYRRFADADGKNGKRFVGAVAGTIIAENVVNFAHDNGLYVIIQSARAVEILAQPEGFKAKEW